MNLIAQAIERKKLTQYEVAKQTGYTPTHIRDLVLGHRRVTIDAARRLAPVLGVKPRQLLKDQFERELEAAGVE